ncbi:MAG TPA: hypothetical protein VII44_05510, partial [Puia sp.]
MRQKLFIFIALFTAWLPGLYAQTGVGNLEFIENKGQWDSAVRYRAEMPNSTFFLQKHGFSVLLQSPADMEALGEALHGVPSTGKTPTKTDNSSTSKKAGGAPEIIVSMSVPGDPVKPNKGNGSGISNTSLVMHSHLYQVEFLNSSEQVEIKGDKALDTYNNYFIGNDRSKWQPNCKIFQAVVYKNIYPDIDLRYYTDNGQLKYDLVVHPGG